MKFSYSINYKNRNYENYRDKIYIRVIYCYVIK